MSEKELSPYLRVIAKSGATRHPGGLKSTSLLLNKTRLTNHSRVLDIGCGAGHTSAYLAQKFGCQVYGLDLSQDALDNAKALYKDEPYFSQVKFFKGDISSLPFLDGYFDLVLCESVLLFVDDKLIACSEMNRVLKPKGFLLLNELCLKDSPKNKIIAKYFARPEFSGFLSSAQKLLAVFNKLGLDIIIEDEQSLDIKSQIKSDLGQFFNMKGLLQLLEFMHMALTSKSMRDDLLKLLNFAQAAPKGALSQIQTLLVLAQKKN